VLQTFNKENFDEINDANIEYFNMKNKNNMISDQNVDKIDKIIFTYKKIPSELNIQESNIHLPDDDETEINYDEVYSFKFSGFHLPLSSDFTK
jgi:hypothetical protein